MEQTEKIEMKRTRNNRDGTNSDGTQRNIRIYLPVSTPKCEMLRKYSIYN